MSGYGPQDAADAKIVDDLTRARFHTEPVEDRSGMLLRSGPSEGEPSEDEQFDAYMQRYFPAARG